MGWVNLDPLNVEWLKMWSCLYNVFESMAVIGYILLAGLPAQGRAFTHVTHIHNQIGPMGLPFCFNIKRGPLKSDNSMPVANMRFWPRPLGS